MDKPKKPIGFIYRIFKPSLLTNGADGLPRQLSYVGRTKTSIEKRFREHKKAAQNWRLSSGGAGDGKLHANMLANDPETFHIEELYVAYSESELSQLEDQAINEFDSIQYGWNKIKASTIPEHSEAEVTVRVKGELKHFVSIAAMCRDLGISNSSLTYQKRKKNSLDEAVAHCLDIAPQSKPIEVFRKSYPSINEATRDQRLNKHGLSKSVIARRHASGMTWEQAFSTPLQKQSEKQLKVTTPDGIEHSFTSIAAAYRSLSSSYQLPSYTSVQQCLNHKNETPEQAFGFAPKPWELAYKEAKKLIDESGYKMVGTKKHSSKPLIAHDTKEVFASAKVLADTYNFSYYGVVDDVNEGLNADQIILKRKY